jgi:hypothetical protein
MSRSRSESTDHAVATRISPLVNPFGPHSPGGPRCRRFAFPLPLNAKKSRGFLAPGCGGRYSVTLWGVCIRRKRGPLGSPLFWVFVRRRPTLPHRHQCSTIGACGLSFRVRNGSGRFPTAMATVTLWNIGPAQPTVAGLGGFPLFGNRTVDADVFVVKSSAY